ncbi:MAG: chalcone isomerase family protein [Shewanella sp.]|nr:chalcone isomerase family protein [Shewanella sp.]
MNSYPLQGWLADLVRVRCLALLSRLAPFYMSLFLSLLMSLPLAVKPAFSGELSGIAVGKVGQSQTAKQSILWREVGRGQMSLLWFDLYRAGLFTPTGQYRSGDYPIRLQIEYLRDIEAKDLLEATLEQWQLLGYPPSEIASWHQALQDLWPDVQRGQSLSFDCHSADIGQFYFNGERLGAVSEPGFARAFLAIWLSPDTSRPELRAQLLGEKTCDC